MTGKEAIIHYLGTHKSFCAQDVAAVHIFHHASESGSGTEETGRYDLVRKYLCSVLNVLSKE